MNPKVFLEKDVKYQNTGPKETDKGKWKEVTRAHKKVFKNSSAGSTAEGNRHSCYVPLFYMELEICDKNNRHNRAIKDAEKDSYAQEKQHKQNGS